MARTAQHHHADHADTSQACDDADTRSTRSAKGRFQPGTSGNPNGRPPKRKPGPYDALLKVLDEQLPAGMAGSSRSMTVEEALARAACMQAMRNPRDALRILETAARGRGAQGEAVAVEPSVECEQVLSAHLERQKRLWERMRDAEPDHARSNSLVLVDDGDD